MNEQLLEVVGITKIFPGTKALDKVDFSLEKGEIHALMGENGAGKSTLMGILSGVFQPNEGKIIFEGEEMAFKTPLEARNKGIGIVFQELSLFPKMTVSENIFLNRQPTKMDFVDVQEMHRQAEKLMEEFGVDIDVHNKVETLSISQQQVVEIVRVLSLNPKVMILDEPTSALSQSEADKLFELILKLKEKGIGIIYISHRMKEIFQIADRITVLRDGKYIATAQRDSTNEDEIIKMMVGRDSEFLYPPKSTYANQEVLLKVNHLSVQDRVDNISFDIRKGEILGVFGLMGAGRTEMARAIFGSEEQADIDLEYEGEKIHIKSESEALNRGISYLTEDRKQDGLFLKFKLSPNIASNAINKLSSGFLWNEKNCVKAAKRAVDNFNIKVSSGLQPIGDLSGGNQQKVLLSKVLLSDPKVLIIDEPTRGIDVGAKCEIHNFLRKEANKGMAIVMISSELPEIIGMSDRIIIMCNGKITGELKGSDITEEKVMALASSF